MRFCVAGSKWQDSSTSHGWDGYPTEYEPVLFKHGNVVELAGQYLTAYRALCAPMADEDLIREVTRLRMSVAKRPEEDCDWQFMLETWLEDLAGYPADIVLWAIGYWRRNERWWPTWSEFKRLLDRRVAQRKAAMAFLGRVAAQ